MNLSSENLINCSKCSNFTFSCQCICPYCGDTIDSDCNCLKKTLEIKNTEIKLRLDFQYDSIKEPTEIQDLIKEYDDEWRRLEKWQVGRRNFP